MVHSQTHSSAAVTALNSATVANILPLNTLMPLACDECDHEQNYAMKALRTLPLLTCQHCQAQRQFSQFELNVLESTLKDMGYYFSRAR